MFSIGKAEKSKADDSSTPNSSEIGKKRKAAEQKKEWFDIDPKKNNNVYVSGLPETTSEEEFEELMSKCGIIMDDDSGKRCF